MERRPQQRRNNRNLTAEESLRSIHDVPDDLLRLILLRLDSPLWLLRAACACRRWRRAVVAGDDDGGRTFLRLTSSLHPPAVVGHYHNKDVGRRIVFVPSSLPSIDGGRFSLDFLPRGLFSQMGWPSVVADCHGDLALLLLRESSIYDYEPEGPELVVCDPLTSRHQGIYLPPDEKIDYDFADVVFLLDGDDGNISISNFRVLYRFDKGYGACVFSTADGGGWRLLRKPANGDAVGGLALDHRPDRTGRVAGRIDGALYVGLTTGTVMVLDNASLEFSEVDLPIRVDTSDSRHGSSFTVVHGAAGGDPSSPPTTRIVHVYGEELEVFRRVHGSSKWVLEHSIHRLLEAARGVASSYLLVGWWPEVDVMAGGTGLAFVCAWLRVGVSNRTSFFSVDVETMELQEVPNKEAFHGTSEVFACTLPWPRFLRACPC